MSESKMSGPAARLTLITLGVRDLDRSRAFYEALGFCRKARGAEGVAFFDAGGVILSLWTTSELAKDAGITIAEPTGYRAMSLAWNVASREEADAALARAVSAGATIVRKAETVFWGGYTAYFADPDGHVWEIAHNPGFPLTPDGRLALPE
jgi:catechol 2,3-dioxygenase-like lactoylglutathione lyase family enzyme